MSKFIPIINNQYIVIREIGAGDFSSVFKAWDSMLQKIVVIKKINKECSSDSEYVSMFRKEAVNSAKLEHKNIVRVVNFVKEEGYYYIIMDYVKGISLEILLEKCHKNSLEIPLRMSLYIISEIAEALKYAHSMRDELTGRSLNIIHRHISPGNIMLFFDGKIKLADFGIATSGVQHQKEKLKGRVSYMSPEQAEMTKNVDVRSDIFSCGAVLFEMLTKQKPFSGNTDVDIWRKVRVADVDMQKLIDSEIPEEVQGIIHKALKKASKERYQNALEMIFEIRRYLKKGSNIDELEGKYKVFVKNIMKEEIEALKKEMKGDATIDFKAVLNSGGIL